MSNEDWARALINQCAEDRGQLEKYRKKVRGRDPKLKDAAVVAEDAIVGSMIGELDYAVTHMQRYVGQKRAPKPTRLDRKLFPSLDIEPEHRLTDERREELTGLLSELSVREQQCLLLYMAYGMSYAAIGRELKVSKYAVRDYVERARAKVAQGV